MFSQFLFFFNRHLVQAYRVKTVQSVFPITVKINTDAIVLLATQADTVKQVYIHASNTLNLEKCYYVLFRSDFLETVKGSLILQSLPRKKFF